MQTLSDIRLPFLTDMTVRPLLRTLLSLRKQFLFLFISIPNPLPKLNHLTPKKRLSFLWQRLRNRSISLHSSLALMSPIPVSTGYRTGKRVLLGLNWYHNIEDHILWPEKSLKTHIYMHKHTRAHTLMHMLSQKHFFDLLSNLHM